MRSAGVPACAIPGVRTLEITALEEPRLRAFFDANPEYFLLVSGEPAGPGEAYEEIHGDVPAGWSFTKRWLLGHVDRNDELIAVLNVTTDLLAEGVWHIGLFIVATALHGTGLARSLHGELETWARADGAKWLRLGVVKGNGRAERFWESVGYMEVRTRAGVKMGKLTNTLRVMVKPLSDQGLEHYSQVVARDRPESAQ